MKQRAARFAEVFLRGRVGLRAICVDRKSEATREVVRRLLSATADIRPFLSRVPGDL